MVYMVNIVIRYYCAGLYEQATAQCQKILDMNPNYPAVYQYLGLIYIAQDMFDEAILNSEKFVGFFGSMISDALPQVGYMYGRAGRETEAREILQRLETESEQMYIPPFYFAWVHTGLGEKDKAFIYADCAVNIDPTAGQLADIALASAVSARRLLGQEPRVALLSFSTKGSGAGESVKKVREALRIAKQREPGLAIDGEFQADSAIIPRVAAKKVKDESAVAGKANVIIFPDLNSGNIAYKLTQYMANAQAIGPFLQGFAKPITDLSRGATVDDVVATVILTLGQLL